MPRAKSVSPTLAYFLVGSVIATSLPIGTTLNGTYSGVYSTSFEQDFFLGIPYLQAPVDDRRFHPADSLTSSWNGTRNATAYAPSCVGYGPSDHPDDMSEDCLYLNIVRPHQNTTAPSDLLPVVIYFHGGGFSGGSARDGRYNLSSFVARSVKQDQPVIAVSFNYRLSAWGFLYSNQIRDTGATNVGLRDQRYALQWVQENIAGFGGDPQQVTVWGQGAGASSVGFQLTAYAGRDDGLLRGAILQSGNPVPARGLNGTQYFQPLYDALTQQDTCWVSPDRMACLRTVPFAEMNAAINATSPHGWFPVIDGDIVSEQPSRSLYTRKFVPVPIILGAATDEGTAQMPAEVEIVTDEDFVDLVANPQSYGVAPGIALPQVLVDQITAAYANVSSVPAVKARLYQGDATVIANRRQACATWSRNNVTTYCYRWNVALDGAQRNAQHGDDLPFVFDNTRGTGYEHNPLNTQSFVELAAEVSGSWVSFVATLNPNAWKTATNSSVIATSITSQGGIPIWPQYGAPHQHAFVFQANGTSYVEEDTWRATPIRLINGPPSGIAVAYQR
ncbi:carboxylesterase family protein-like protein [Aspergillus indologenus CBS 114.80]|uniref:Carboxylesterase family protein-like protein n=1 Tax=Aspergillus indologenus CBS 114.80 TaxID=1450541 RepID=A0A2V5HWH9_9EURO|nr:carboxylesterase family protein-like protein [Aspergillus indologenus CBS 114.80]